MIISTKVFVEVLLKRHLLTLESEGIICSIFHKVVSSELRSSAFETFAGLVAVVCLFNEAFYN